jgi:2-polyprenyl-6-methoxyphenol hydroxylase-like FAD-dependent oxidoreductase
MRIIINGIGIAGPTLAYWLQKAGHEVLLVEAAPKLRGGGYVIDFGLVGYDVAEKMGIIPRLRELGYRIKEVRFVDRHGHKRGSISADSIRRLLHDRTTSLRRSDLAATIYASLNGAVETIFGDSVARIEEMARSVWVSFDHSPPREADLIIGADGFHSRVRQLVFGPDKEVEVSLGYHVAAFEVDGYRPRDELVYLGYGVPGRQIFRFSMRDDKTLFLFVFRDEYLPAEKPNTEPERKAALAHAFMDVGWECPAILRALAGVRDMYFDRVSQIRLDRWTKGRTALVGDAAACVSLVGGEGAGLAMAEAYVLAGELRNCAGDYGAAFARYEERLMPFLKRKQRMAARFASGIAPKTAFGIAFRNFITRLARIPFLFDFFFRREVLREVKLPDYGF